MECSDNGPVAPFPSLASLYLTSIDKHSPGGLVADSASSHHLLQAALRKVPVPGASCSVDSKTELLGHFLAVSLFWRGAISPPIAACAFGDAMEDTTGNTV